MNFNTSTGLEWFGVAWYQVPMHYPVDVKRLSAQSPEKWPQGWTSYIALCQGGKGDSQNCMLRCQASRIVIFVSAVKTISSRKEICESAAPWARMILAW